MANIHIIIGEDDFLVAEAAKRIIGDGVGLELVDSLTSTNAELQLADLRTADESLMTPPFLEPKKVTWWRNVGFLPAPRKKEETDGDGKSSSEDVKLALEKFARRLASVTLPENQHFILSGPRLLKTSVFAKTVSPAAEMLVFETQKPWQAVKSAVARAIDLASEAGLRFDAGAAELFVARVGTDARSLTNEIGKLRSYLGADGRTICANDIIEVSSRGVSDDPAIWDLTDPIADRDLGAATAALARFEGTKNAMIPVVGAIERLFRQMVELKDADERGFFDEASGGLAPFVAAKMRRFVAKWTLAELRAARARFLRLRERAVSTSDDISALVTVGLVRAIGRRRR